MEIYQYNFTNNNSSFKGRGKKLPSFNKLNTQYQRTDSQVRIELPILRSDYLIMSNGDLKCNHYREGKQIENSDFYETIAITPIDSNEDVLYNPACDYSCINLSDKNLNQIKLTTKETKNYADSLSKRILNYASQNKDLLGDEKSQSYFYSLLNNDFSILNDKSKNIISKYISLDDKIRKKKYDSYCALLSENIMHKENKVFYKYCINQKKLLLAKENGQVYDNKEIILKKLSEHKEEINYLWVNIFTMTSMFKGIFINFFDLSDLPCSCCGKPLKNDEISVEHIRPHSIGRKLMRNIYQNDKFNIVNQKFNSPRNFIFEHQICNGKRGNMDFINFLNSTEENFGHNVINNINGIIELIKNDENLLKSLKSYKNFVQYSLKDILFYYKNKTPLLKILVKSLKKYQHNKQITKNNILNELNYIIKKKNFSNYRVINSIKKDIEKIFNKPYIKTIHLKKILKNQINIEKEESKKPIVKKIYRLLNSKYLNKIMTKNEIDNLLYSYLNLSNINNAPIIREIKYLYNQYCVLKYYPPVISKTIYRETGGKINIGLSSWADLMDKIDNSSIPLKKITFYSKYIKPIGNYIASLFPFTQTRVSNLPRI